MDRRTFSARNLSVQIPVRENSAISMSVPTKSGGNADCFPSFRAISSRNETSKPFADYHDRSIFTRAAGRRPTIKASSCFWLIRHIVSFRFHAPRKPRRPISLDLQVAPVADVRNVS